MSEAYTPLVVNSNKNWLECKYTVNNNKNYHPSFNRSKKMKLRLKQIKP